MLMVCTVVIALQVTFGRLAMWRIKEALIFGLSLIFQVQNQLKIKPKPAILPNGGWQMFFI
jgi:hypothetical protein